MEETSKRWTCPSCGLVSQALEAPDAKTRCECCGEPAPFVATALGDDLLEDSRRRDILARLRERYVEARELAGPAEHYANLDWILGSRRNPRHDGPAFDDRLIELVVLWLQDLAFELGRGSSPRVPGDLDEGARSLDGARENAALGLRAATEEFVLTFLQARDAGHRAPAVG